ncbi:glycosyl transferase family protein [Gracilaria domingensis]|nr:glycosyl transferase family protein [Gracilaria domingensis]
MIFSFIVTCTEGATGIEQTLLSIFQQSYRRWEVILIDSTTGAKCIERTNAAKELFFKKFRDTIESQIRIISGNSFSDIVGSTYGASVTLGSFLCFISPGEFLAPNFLLEAWGEASSAPEVIVMYGDKYIIGEKRSFLWIEYALQSLEIAKVRSSIPTTMLIKRNTLFEIVGFRSNVLDSVLNHQIWLEVVYRATSRKRLNTLRKLKNPVSWSTHFEAVKEYSEGLNSLSWSLFTLRHAVQPKKICTSLRNMYCEETFPLLSELEKSLWRKEDQCVLLNLLALLKMKHKCIRDVRILLDNGRRSCAKFKNQKSLAIFLSTIHSLIESGLIERKVKDKTRCEKEFLNYCNTGGNGHPSKYFLKQSSHEHPYFPYFSPKADNILRSNPEFKKEAARKFFKSYEKGPSLMKIPNIFHFVFGFKEGTAALAFYQYVSVISAIVHNSPNRVIFHALQVPTGKWWKHLKSKVELKVWKKRDINSPRCLLHYAHMSDYIRLLALKEYGGIYMDLDVLSFRPLNISIDSEFGIARQNIQTQHTSLESRHNYQLSNSVMISVPNSTFVRVWLDSYRYFRSLGKDVNWDEHSSRLPSHILDQFTDLILLKFVSVLPGERFWSISSYDTETFFRRVPSCDDHCFLRRWKSAEVFHLGVNNATLSYRSQLELVGENHIETFRNTLIGSLLRRAGTTSRVFRENGYARRFLEKALALHRVWQ